MFFSTRLIRFIDLNVGFSKGVNKAWGLTAETKLNIKKYKYQPFIGFAYTKSFGNSFDVTINENPTYYKINPTDFFIPEIGITRLIHVPNDPDKPNLNMIVLISLNCSYSYAQVEPKLIYVSVLILTAKKTKLIRA